MHAAPLFGELGDALEDLRIPRAAPYVACIRAWSHVQKPAVQNPLQALSDVSMLLLAAGRDSSPAGRLVQDIRGELHSIGWRALKDIVTPQEEYLIGSSPALEALTRPYLPLPLHTSPERLDEIVRARELQGYLAALPLCFGLPQTKELLGVYASLEPLVNGETRTDPRPFNELGEPIASYMAQFPFARTGTHGR